MSSKKTAIEVLSFKRLKTRYKTVLESPSTSKAETQDDFTYNALSKLDDILENALFPTFSFEPQKDVSEIINVTSRRNKNKDVKRSEQQEALSDKSLMKRTCFQWFESFNQCFGYMPNLQQKDTLFLKLSDSMIKTLKGMLQPPENVSHVYVMPIFLACAMAFKKLERKKQLSFGITMERLTSGPGIPMVDKPWSDYQRSFIQAMMLHNNVNRKIERQSLIEYAISWEGNTPSIVDYRLFLMSIHPFFHMRMLKFYESIIDKMNPVYFFYEFLFVHRPFYCQERSTGFLSAQWLLPLNLSMVFSASEIGNFTSVHPRNITEEGTLIHKANFDIRSDALFVFKQSSMFEVVSIHPNIHHDISEVQLPGMMTEVDDEAISNTKFVPPIDFNQRDIMFNVKNYESVGNSMPGLIASTNAMKDQRRVFAKLKHLKSLSTVYHSAHRRKDIFDGRRYALSLTPNDVNLAHDYQRRLMMNEAMHQWSRDLFVMEIIQNFLERLEKETSALDAISFIHEVFIKPSMLNEFDRIMLNNDYVFDDVIQKAPSQIKRTMADVPITSNDVMMIYFVFLNQMYGFSLTTMKIDLTYLQVRTDIAIVNKHIREFPPSSIIKWMAMWLSLQDIPYTEGFDVQNSQFPFNRRMLPMLYMFECLPIRKKQYNKHTCFSSKVVHDNEYLWSNTTEFTTTVYHSLEDLIARQVDLAKLLFFKTAYLTSTDETSKLATQIDPKRYFLYKNRLFSQNNNDLVRSLLNISSIEVSLFSSEGKTFHEICQDLLPVKDADITQIQNMIDFYMTCLNQFNASLQYLIIRGNEFISTTTQKKEKRVRGGAAYTSEGILVTDGAEENPRLIEFPTIVNPPNKKKTYAPRWLFDFNPNLAELQKQLNVIKRDLNEYRRPNPEHIEFFTRVVNVDYPLENNENVIDVMPLVSEIIAILDDMIKNNQIVDFTYADEKANILNETLDEFIHGYLVDPPTGSNHYFRRHVKTVEHFDPMKLDTIAARREKLYRWIFVERYLSQRYQIVNEFYDVMETVRFNSVGMDAQNTETRLMHSLYEINNFINRDFPVMMNPNHEIIERMIALAAVNRSDLPSYIEKQETIVEVSNFAYLFKSRLTGIRYGHTISSLPSINARWKIKIKNIRWRREFKFHVNSSIPIEPDMTGLQDQAMYKICLPLFPDNALMFIEQNTTCQIYARLDLFLVKPTVHVDSIDQETDLVVYPPLSMPEASIMVLGQDALRLDEEKVYQRINRFNNFMYIHQPDELHFLEAHITQELLDEFSDCSNH
jgi:hypothetical protein